MTLVDVAANVAIHVGAHRISNGIMNLLFPLWLVSIVCLLTILWAVFSSESRLEDDPTKAVCDAHLQVINHSQHIAIHAVLLWLSRFFDEEWRKQEAARYL